MAGEACAHERSEVRSQMAAHGEIFARQCLDCGVRVGNWIKRAEALTEAGGVPAPFDAGIAEAWLQRVDDAARSEQRAWWSRYRAYLGSPEWAAARAKVMRRAKGLCEGCGEVRASDVHHLTYAHVGAEFLFELVALCRACHVRWHAWGKDGGT